MFRYVKTAYGIARSLQIYYGDKGRARTMDTLYRPFVPAASLAFDIGSHVGDRVACFRRLGARVIAVEPQHALVRTLRTLYRRDPGVTIFEAAVGAFEGDIELHLNPTNPTVSTASRAFIEAASGAPGWQGQRWTETARVPMVTLDGLISRYGQPSFMKVDVEGLEAEVLAGLSTPIAALSFEFTTIQRQPALDCLAACTQLGDYCFNAALGETHQLVHGRWLKGEEIASWVSNLSLAANSGDIYARLCTPSVS